MSGKGHFVKKVNRSIILLFLGEVPFLVFEDAPSMSTTDISLDVSLCDEVIVSSR